MPIVQGRHLPLYSALFAVFVLFGASLTLVGAILPRIFDEFRWSYFMAGLVLASGSVGTIAGAFVGGRLLHHRGVRLTALLGLGLNAAGLLLFARGPSVPLNMLLYFGIGLGQGFLEISVNWSVVRMSGPGDGRAMNLIHGAFSIGAVLGPLVLGALLAADLSWSLPFRAVALIYLALFLAAFGLPFGMLGRDEVAAKGAKRLRRGPAYTLGFLTLFFYVGAEVGISNWCAEFFVRTFGTSAATGALVVSLFWAGLLAGRLGFPLLLPRVRPERLIVVLATAFALSTGLVLASGFAGTPALLLGFAAVAAAGLGASCVYPSTITLVGDAFPSDQGRAVGFAATGGALGAFVFPFAMSGIAGRAGLVAGFTSYAGVAVLAAALAMALASAARAAGGGSAKAGGTESPS